MTITKTVKISAQLDSLSLHLQLPIVLMGFVAAGTQRILSKVFL